MDRKKALKKIELLRQKQEDIDLKARKAKDDIEEQIYKIREKISELKVGDKVRISTGVVRYQFIETDCETIGATGVVSEIIPRENPENDDITLIDVQGRYGKKWNIGLMTTRKRLTLIED